MTEAVIIMITASAMKELRSIVQNQVVSKTVEKKFSFSELKIEKIICFTQSSTKIFCISFFNVSIGLASCLTIVDNR